MSAKNKQAQAMAALRWKGVTPAQKAAHIRRLNRARLAMLKERRENAGKTER